MRKLMMVACAVVISACTHTIKEVSITSMQRDVEFLASDECDGRLPFTEGADRASDYIAERMQSIGLQPINNNSFKQNVPLAMIKTDAQDAITVQTPKGPLNLQLKKDFTAFTQSLEPEIDIKDAELFFAGYGIVAPEYNKNDYIGLTNPENKIAVVIVNDPGLGTDGDYFKGDAMTYYGRWTYKFEEGARQGLKGVLIIHDDRGAGYGWSVVAASEERFALNDSNISQSSGTCPLNGWLTKETARQLLTNAGYNPDEIFEQAKRPDFKPFSLNSTLSIKMSSTFEYNESPNLVGYIPGTTDECIVCTAHWDHLGHASASTAGASASTNEDVIINGATDNATGVAWLLETARVLKNTNPKRSIVFLAPTCEEKGLYGSQYYTEHPLVNMQNTVAVINMDVIPLWGENNDVTVTGLGHSELDQLLTEVAKDHGRYVMADPDAFNGMFYRSDQLPFMRKGVPALFAKGWSDNRARGKQWATEMIRDYWASVYHKPADETHETDDYAGLKQDVELFADLILRLANSADRPHWYPTSEFAH